MALQESIESRVYWEKRKESDMSVMKVCRDVLKPNAKNWDEENWTEVCDWETGAITGTVMRGLENAEARNRSRFEEWSQIVKLYPDCFDPDKVIEANS